MFEIYNFNYNEQYNNELCSLVETERRNYFNILRNDYSWKYQKSFRYLYNSKYVNSTMLDRMIFNKTCISKFLPQYKIINETSPTYTTIGKLHVGNAGYFIVNKL